MQLTTTNLISLTAKVAATGLCLASAAFGGVYAYTVGIHGGILLAGITVLFAVCLELVKPLAIVGACQAFREWSPGKGLALLFLGLLAVAYSVTSELSLMSASRGDLTAERAQAHTSQTMARDAYERARRELATLKPSRTVGEVEAQIAKQSAKGCGAGASNASSKWVCPVPASLLSELARAKRKAELEATMQTTSNQVTTGPAVANADPGSVNLATYLSALGLDFKPETIAQWLALIPVLALEAGSALACLLVQAVGRPAVSVGQLESAVRSGAPKAPEQEASERDRVANAIVSHLQACGGAIRGSHRKLAAKVGADRNTVGRALQGLAASGLVAMAATKSGTVLKLAA